MGTLYPTLRTRRQLPRPSSHAVSVKFCSPATSLHLWSKEPLDHSSTHHLFWGGLSKPGPKCARTYSCTSVRAGSGVSCRYNLPVRRPLARATKKTGTLGRQRLKFPTRPIDSDSLDGIRRKLLPCHYPVLSSRLQPCTSCRRPSGWLYTAQAALPWSLRAPTMRPRMRAGGIANERSNKGR